MFENEKQLFMLDTFILTRGKSFTLSESEVTINWSKNFYNNFQSVVTTLVTFASL